MPRRKVYYDAGGAPEGYLPREYPYDFFVDADVVAPSRPRLPWLDLDDDAAAAAAQAYLPPFPPETFDPDRMDFSEYGAPGRLRLAAWWDDADAHDPATYVVFVDTPEFWPHDDEPPDIARAGWRAAFAEPDPLEHWAGLFGTFDTTLLAYDEEPHSSRLRSRLARWDDDEPVDPALFVVLIYAPDDDPIYSPRPARHYPLATLHSSDDFTWWEPVGGDSVRWYFTGAASDGGAQASQAASLGNFRSSTEAERNEALIREVIPGLSILFVSGANVAGDGKTEAQTGSITVQTGDRVRYTAPGSSTPGPAVTIALVNQTALLADGDEPSKWVRVQRTAAAALKGVSTLLIHRQLNNVFGFTDAPDALSAAGGQRYRGVMLRVESLAAVRDIALWVDPLGAAQITAASQLPAAGAGTIAGATDCFCGWPSQGWARIESAPDILREIVYYSGRPDDQTLTIPAAGRARLGSTAAAGATGDLVYPVPGVRFAVENASPLRNGSIQTIANESTAPAAVAWSTAITEATAVAVGTLHTYQQVGVWLDRDTPAGAVGIAKVLQAIKCRFTTEAVIYTETLAGLYRIEDLDLSRLEMHVGTDGAPSLTAAPTETWPVADPTNPAGSLPVTSVSTLAPGHTYQVVLNYRNPYNLRSENIVSQVLTIDGAGVLLTNKPTAPTVLSWEAAAGGTFLAKIVYFYNVDATAIQADQYLIYTRFDGVDPVPGVDVPTVVTIPKTDGSGYYEFTSAAFAPGTTGKILVRTRRAADTADSTNTDVHSATAATAGPSTPSGSVFSRGIAEHE